MAINVTCGECDWSGRVGDEQAGKTGRCPKCPAVIVVPALRPSAAAAETVDPPSADAAAPEPVATSPPPPPPPTTPSAVPVVDTPAQVAAPAIRVPGAPAPPEPDLSDFDDDDRDPTSDELHDDAADDGNGEPPLLQETDEAKRERELLCLYGSTKLRPWTRRTVALWLLFGGGVLSVVANYTNVSEALTVGARLSSTRTIDDLFDRVWEAAWLRAVFMVAAYGCWTVGLALLLPPASIARLREEYAEKAKKKGGRFAELPDR